MTNLFVSVLTIALGVIYFFSQKDLGSSLGQILTVVGLSFFLVYFPEKIQRFLPEKNNVFLSKPALFIYGLIILTIGGLLANIINLGLIFVILGFAFFLLSVPVHLKSANLKDSLITVFWGILFSLLTAGIVWGSSYQNPLFLEKIGLGTAHIDTLFHSSISSMIRTYSVPSTGLNGLPFLHYYWGSHFVFAQISKLLKINPLDFYNLAYPVIFVPFLIKSILTFASQAQTNLGFKKFDINKSLLVLFLGFAGVLPATIFAKIGLFYTDIFISESFLLATGLLFLLMSLVLIYLPKKTQKITSYDFIFLIVFFPVFLGLLGMIKSPLAFLALGAYGYFLIRLKLFTRARYVVSFLLSTLVAIFIYRLATPAGDSAVNILHFLKNYVSPNYRGFYWLLYYLLAWIFIYLRFSDAKVRNFADLKPAFTSKRYVDVEILIVFSIIGFLPGAIFALKDGAASYFSSFQYWFALSLILLYLPKIWPGKTKILPAVIICGLLLISLFNTYNRFRPFVLENTNIRKSFASQRNDEKTQMVTKLYNLSKDTSIDKAKTAIFIPQKNYTYWNLLPYKKIQFVVPSLSGMALIEGIQPFVPENDIVGKNLSDQEKIALYNKMSSPYFDLLTGYGYASYDKNISEEKYLSDTKDDTSICQLAVDKGFNKVLILEDLTGKEDLRTIECKH